MTHPGYVVVLDESKILLLGMGATEASSCVSNLGHVRITVRINEKKGFVLRCLAVGDGAHGGQGAPGLEVTTELGSTTMKVGRAAGGAGNNSRRRQRTSEARRKAGGGASGPSGRKEDPGAAREARRKGRRGGARWGVAAAAGGVELRRWLSSAREEAGAWERG